MELHKLEELIAKYWEGETSLEEEKLIRQNANMINDDHIRSYFASMESFSRQEMYPPVDLPLEQKQNHLFRLRVLAPYAIAASLAAVIWWKIPIKSLAYDPVAQETFEDPELARLQAEEALSYVFSRMRSGQQTSQKQFKKIEALSLVIPN